jgi:hypothetical protein
MITALFELFAFGGILFWIALASLVFVLTALTERNWHFTKLLLMGGLVALFWPNVKTLTGTQLTVIAVSYFIIGIIYSFIRWFNEVNNTISKYGDFLKKHAITDLNKIDTIINSLSENISKLDSVPQIDRDKAFEKVYREVNTDHDQFERIKHNITPNENKTALYNWIFYWPWCIIRFFTADLAEALYQLSKNQYKNIVNHLLRKNLA